jgi:Domain of unknown function (DUF2017)
VGGRFRKARGRSGAVTVTLTDVEADVLGRLFAELLTLLAEPEPSGPDVPEEDPLAAELGIGTSTRLPEDPVLARLFPDAYREDPEAAADFRRYTERGLRERKQTAASTALASLQQGTGRLVLDAEQAQAWLLALNDARLALGEILGVTEDAEPELAEDDPAALSWAVYDLITFMQDSLVRCLS